MRCIGAAPTLRSKGAPVLNTYSVGPYGKESCGYESLATMFNQ
jgi:hypothetical protein